MRAPIYEIVYADAIVQSLLASGPALRFYEFGEAPQGVIKPYVVWQLAGGLPENQLAGVPKMDTFRLQIDVYADKGDKAREVAQAIRDAIEPHSYLTSYNFDGREPETRLFRYSFNVEFMVPRETGS